MSTPERVTITRVVIKPSIKRDGTPNLSRGGKALFSVGILTDKYPDRWYNNNFMPFSPDRWQGTEQELVLSMDNYGYKFALPDREGYGRPQAFQSPGTSAPIPQNRPAEKPTEEVPGPGALNVTLQHLHFKVDKIIRHLSGVDPLNLTSAGTKVPDFNADDQDGPNDW